MFEGQDCRLTLFILFEPQHYLIHPKKQLAMLISKKALILMLSLILICFVSKAEDQLVFSIFSIEKIGKRIKTSPQLKASSNATNEKVTERQKEDLEVVHSNFAFKDSAILESRSALNGIRIKIVNPNAICILFRSDTNKIADEIDKDETCHDFDLGLEMKGSIKGFI